VDGLLAQLESLQESNFLPVSLDNDDVDSLLRAIEAGDEDGEEESSTQEIDPDDFEFEHKCPKCGFEFND
jgi:hypothetical protein